MLKPQKAKITSFPKMPRLDFRRTAPQDGQEGALVLTRCWQDGHSIIAGLAI